MSNKVCFQGEKCFDLIHYTSRILYRLGCSVLIVDLSTWNDRSLEMSVPIPEGIAKGHTVDYNGVRFSPHYYQKYEKEYDYILIYNGSRKLGRTLLVDRQFIICNSRLDSIKNAELILEDSSLNNNAHRHNTFSQTKENLFNSNEPVVLYLDISIERIRFIRSRLNVSEDHFRYCELAVNDIELGINVQYDNTFRFNKLSADYKDIVLQCVLSIIDNNTTDKQLTKAVKEAERGK